MLIANLILFQRISLLVKILWLLLSRWTGLEIRSLEDLH